MKLNLRGKSREFLTTIGKNINMILPMEANTSLLVIIYFYVAFTR